MAKAPEEASGLSRVLGRKTRKKERKYSAITGESRTQDTEEGWCGRRADIFLGFKRVK